LLPALEKACVRAWQANAASRRAPMEKCPPAGWRRSNRWGAQVAVRRRRKLPRTPKSRAKVQGVPRGRAWGALPAAAARLNPESVRSPTSLGVRSMARTTIVTRVLALRREEREKGLTSGVVVPLEGCEQKRIHLRPPAAAPDASASSPTRVGASATAAAADKRRHGANQGEVLEQCGTAAWGTPLPLDHTKNR
jgi:hypothetical protein